MKKGTIIRVIDSCPVEGQEGIEKFINNEYEVVAHWKQKNIGLEAGEIQVDIDGIGLSTLNSKEYEVVKN